MPTSFSQPDVDRLRREAKALRQSTAIPLAEALDRVAGREGWPNWALLHRNASKSSINEALQTSVEEFRGGDKGVYVVRLAIDDRAIRRLLDRAGGLSFSLSPVPSRWIVRRLTDVGKVATDPYLQQRWSGSPRGRFVDGRFFCILSVNGVPAGYLNSEIAEELSPMVAKIRWAALEALESRLRGDVHDERVRLFYSVPNARGIQSLRDCVVASVDDAMQATLPDSAVPIGIATSEGWWAFRAPFGWLPPE